MLFAFGRLLCRFFFRLRVTGLEHATANEPLILCGNHASLLDGPLLQLFYPHEFIFFLDTTVAERWYVRMLHPFFEYRSIDYSNPQALRSMCNELAQGKSICIFPEGRITVTGHLMSMQKGVGFLAKKTNARVLPFRIENAQHTKFSYVQHLVPSRWFVPLRIHFFPPRHVSNPQESRKQAIAATTRRVYDLMSEAFFLSAHRDRTLYAALLERAQLTLPKIKILGDLRSGEITYKRLIIGSIALGGKLNKRFEENEDYIGMLLPNSVGFTVAFFALMLYGKIPALLNFSAGANAVLHAQKITGFSSVLTSRAFVEASPVVAEIAAALGKHCRIVYLEDIRSELGLPAKLNAARLARRADRLHRRHSKATGDSPAVVIYTSGSEGLPKGVVLSHKNILSNIAQIGPRFDFNVQDLCFSALPNFHVFGLTVGILYPLLTGVRLFLYPTPLHYTQIPKLVYTKQATLILGTNTFLAGYAAKADPYDFFRMRMAVAGGEPLQPENRKLWADKFGVRLIEGYGASETSPVLCMNCPFYAKNGTVGRLVSGIEYRFVPVEGVEADGVLQVKGDSVMLGYLDPDNPGKIGPTPEWYDTGDIASLDSEGFLTLSGRVKRFSKIGGEMVSHLAVENLAGEAWREGKHAVVSIAHSRKGEELVLCTSVEEKSLGELKQKLQQTAREKGVSRISLPGRLITVDRLPLLGSGKVDYPKLRTLVLALLGPNA